VDNHSQLFHNRIIEAIRSGEVVCLFFPRFGKTLVLDMRHTLEIPPLVVVDDMVQQPSERIERLQAQRPMLALPEELRIAPWFGSMAGLAETGITSAILERCAATGDVGVVEQCRAALRTLGRLEHKHLQELVRGEASRTIWQRPPDG
jgi:hypothetical protein